MLRRTDAYTIGVLVAALDLVMQVGIAVFGLVLLLSVDALKNSIELGTMPTWNAVAFALPIAMIGYTGLEKVGSLAGVAKNPEKSLPDSVRTSVFTVVIVYSAVATAAVSAFPTHPANNAQGGTTLLATRWVDTPMLGLAHAIGEKGPELGRERASHRRRLHRLHDPPDGDRDQLLRAAPGWPRPWAGIRSSRRSSGGRAAGCWRRRRRSSRSRCSRSASSSSGRSTPHEETLTLASLYSFGILIAFMLTQAAIIWLRISEPDLPRPFMMKGNVWVGRRLIPVTSVVGVVLSFAAWVVALGTHPGARVVGPLWMLGGLVIYAGTRIRAGLPMIERVEDAVLPSEDVTDIAFSTVVVPLERLDAIAEETMATACRLAVEAGAAVVGVSAIYVPVREALDTELPEREAEVAAVQAMAASLADEYGVEYRPVVARTRSPGQARGRRRDRARRGPDRRRLAAEAPRRPKRARGVLRADGRLHPAQGAVPRDRDALPRGRRARRGVVSRRARARAGRPARSG